MKLLKNNGIYIRLAILVFIIAGLAILTSYIDSEGNALLTKSENSIKITEPPQTRKMKGFKINIEKSTLENENFRKVLYTSK